MLKFVKEKLVNCGNSREVVEIEKLTDENNELKTQLSLLKNDQAKRKNLNEARQTELIGEISQLQGELDQSEENENKLRVISQNDKKMLCLLKELLRQALSENAGLRHGKDGLTDEIHKLRDEIEELTIEIEDMIDEIKTNEEEIEKYKQTIQNQNEVIESLRTQLSLLESSEDEIADTTVGKFYKKTFIAQTVLKIARENTKPMTKEAETLRRSLDHKFIVKLHESYTEDNGSTRCFLLEQLDFAQGTLVDVAQQRTENLREHHIWRSLFHLSSALVYLHSRPGGIFANNGLARAHSHAHAYYPWLSVRVDKSLRTENLRMGTAMRKWKMKN